METTGIGKKIIILGCPGSGKSTFARELQTKTGLPLFHLDNIWWKEDKTHISREDFDRRLQILLQGGEWIIDGDYSRTYEPRFAACDTIVFLDYGEEECLAGIAGRIGTVRPDIPFTESALDPELAELVVNYRRENRPKVYELIGRYSEKRALIFGSRAEARAWLSGC